MTLTLKTSHNKTELSCTDDIRDGAANIEIGLIGGQEKSQACF